MFHITLNLYSNGYKKPQDTFNEGIISIEKYIYFTLKCYRLKKKVFPRHND